MLYSITILLMQWRKKNRWLMIWQEMSITLNKAFTWSFVCAMWHTIYLNICYFLWRTSVPQISNHICKTTGIPQNSNDCFQILPVRRVLKLLLASIIFLEVTSSCFLNSTSICLLRGWFLPMPCPVMKLLLM